MAQAVARGQAALGRLARPNLIGAGSPPKQFAIFILQFSICYLSRLAPIANLQAFSIRIIVPTPACRNWIFTGD